MYIRIPPRRRMSLRRSKRSMRMQHLPIWYVDKYLRLLFVYKYNVCASLSIYIMCSIIIAPIQHIIYIYIYIYIYI